MADRNPFWHFLWLVSLAAVYIAFGFLYALDNRDTTHVLYEIFRGKAIAANRAPKGRRILLSGGSNAIWGFRSQLIEDETGVPTYNLALIHEAFSPKAMRDLVRSVVRSGDVVVYSSISFYQSRGTDQAAADELLRVAGLGRTDDDFQKLSHLFLWYWSPFPHKNTIARSLETLYERYVQQTPSIHSQDLNEKGDIKSCVKNGEVGRASFFPPPDRLQFYEPMRAFEHSLRERGASLVLDFPTILVKPEERPQWLLAYRPFLEDLSKHFQIATQDLEHLLLLDEPLFCDSAFHLGKDQAERRSLNLGKYLRSHSIKLTKK